jgi:zinc protease
MSDASNLTRLPTHERRLANGLTALVREDHSSPVVAIVTHVKAGYFDEPDTVVGISHVLEHMYFKGTERRGAGEIALATKSAGGYLNAGTIYDHTTYYTVLPASSLELGLDIQSDALRNSQLDEEELRKELLVIIQEAKRKLDNPTAVALETLYEEMFDAHRIRRWRIGTEEGLGQMTRQDVWDYYRNLYHPANIVLAIAGDVEPEHAFELVERHYGDMPPGEPVREPAPQEAGRTGFRFRETSGDIIQSYMEWGWRTPGTLHPDTVALDVLAVVLGQGRASRLFRGVRESGLVTGISAGNYTPTQIGVFNIGAELLPADSRAAVGAVWREVEALRRDGVSAAEVERATNILEARLVHRLETMEGQANLLAEWQALGDWRLVEDYIGRILATSAEEVQRVATEYLSLEQATLLVYRPDAAAPLGWDAAGLAAELAGSAPAPQPPTPELAPRRTNGRGGARISGVREEDDTRFYTLESGATIVVKPRHAAPLVSMAFSAVGGAVDETPGTAGITGLMTRAMLKGTATRSAAQLAIETEALGGAIGRSVSPDAFSLSLNLPSRHFAHGLELLADVALRPAFEAAEVDRERKVMLSDLEQLRDDMSGYPFQLFLEAAFPDHPYGFPSAWTEQAVATLQRDALADWHRRYFLEGTPWIFIVGDVEPDAAAERAAAELELRRPAAAARPDGGAPTWPSRPARAVEHRAKAQTALVLGLPGVKRSDPAFTDLQILATVISGLGGRLFEELRSRRSLAYTVSAQPLGRRLAGAFVTYIATSPEREEEARQGLLRELATLRDEPVTEEEIERARRYALGTWQIRRQTNSAQIADLAGALLLGRGLEELRDYPDRIQAVTPDSILATTRRLFDPERAVEGIVRGTGGGR